MSDFVEVKVTGLDELQRDLNKLAEALSPKELQPILKVEAGQFARKLSAVPPPLGPTGNLRKGVQAWSPKITKNHPYAMARAGVKYKVAPHVHLVEYGTAERYTKTGAYRGAARPANFIWPLAEAEMPGMLKRVIEAIWNVIEKNWTGRSGNA
jgi:hypothetical protein